MSDNTLDILHDLVGAATKQGADGADAVAVDSTSTGVSWLNGALEDVERSENSDIGLRVMIGKHQAIVSSSDRRRDALVGLVTRALDMARAVPEDAYCGLADADRLLTDALPELGLYDDTDVSADSLAEYTHEMEDAMFQVDGVTTTAGGGASAGSYALAMVTSHGFAGHFKGSSFSASISAVAGEGTGMERDYDFSSKRFYSDLDDAATIGRTAGENAVKRLNPASVKSGMMPVLFDPRVANSLVGHFLGSINGASIASGTSFLKDQLGEAVFDREINIIDDPLMMRGLGSRPFDGEGVTTTKQKLIDGGVLNNWMLNSAYARQLGLETTGHATRGTSSPPGIGGSNVYMEAGTLSPAELMADIKNGIYITELIGMGVNGVTGDYSRGAAGFLIENGIITRPVNEITIAGNLKDMFTNIVAASDLTFKYGTNAPTVRVDGLTVASAG